MKKLGVVLVLVGIATLFLSSVLTYIVAHREAQAFLATHQELEGRSFCLVKDPSVKSQYTVLDCQTLLPAKRFYVLEFDRMVVMVANKDGAAEILWGGFLDSPWWARIISLWMITGGIIQWITAKFKKPKELNNEERLADKNANGNQWRNV